MVTLPLRKSLVTVFLEFIPDELFGVLYGIYTKTINTMVGDKVSEPFHDIEARCSRMTCFLEIGIQLRHFLLIATLGFPFLF